MSEITTPNIQSRATTFEWISDNRYLSYDEMYVNAEIVYLTMTQGYGWTPEATCGMLGNMQRESTINPGIWEGLVVADESGFGLVQWTPSTNYTNWANNLGVDITDGDFQLYWIAKQTTTYGQWIETTSYPLSFEEFYSLSVSPEYLASVFLKNFERAGVEAETERRTNARMWYEYFNNSGNTPTPKKKKKMPVWMMCRHF